MRVKAAVTVPSVDFDALIAAVPFLLDGLRALVVDGTGVVLDDGTRAQGLTVASGAHPFPGVVYRVVMATGPAGSLETWMVSLLDDDTKQVRVHVEDLEQRRTAEVELRRPAKPDSIAFTSAVDPGGGWLTRGRLVVEGRVDLAHLRSGKLKPPQVECSVRHRHLRGRMTVAASAASRHDMSIAVEVVGRGRGLVMFPPSVVAALLFKKMADRQLAKAMQELPAKVKELNLEIEARFGTPPDPGAMATSLLHDLLAEVVVTRPNP